MYYTLNYGYNLWIVDLGTGSFEKIEKMEKESALVTVYFLKASIIIISIIVVIFSI